MLAAVRSLKPPVPPILLLAAAFCVPLRVVASTGGAFPGDADELSLPAERARSAVLLDGRLEEVAWQKAEWTRRFIVPDVETSVNGVYAPAPAKFVENAATAAVVTDDDNLHIAFRAPYPRDFPPVVHKNGLMAYDDHVSVFLRPFPGYVFIVSMDVHGKVEAKKYTEGRPAGRSWHPIGVTGVVHHVEGLYTAEIRIPFQSMAVSLPKDGVPWRVNFSRSGNSCGRRSFWSDTGSESFDASKHGLLLFGGRMAYARAVRESREAVAAANGDGKVIAWEYNPWESFGSRLMPPFGTAGLGRFRFAGPRGARAVGCFLVSNLSATPALYNIAVESRDEEFARCLRLRRGHIVEFKWGRLAPDAIFPLAIGSVLWVDAGSTVPLWLDADCANLSPGVHKASLRMVPGYGGFREKTVDVELFVGSADVREVAHPAWTYTIRWPEAISRYRDYGFNTACLLPFMYLGITKEKGDGDYSTLDKVVRAFVDNGVPTNQINFLLYAEWPRWANFRTPDGRHYRYMTDEWKAEYGRRLKNFVVHVARAYGIGYDRLAFYTNDEPSGDPSDPKSSAWHAICGAEFVHSVDRNLRTFCNPWRCEPEYARRYLEVFDFLEPCLPRLRRQEETLRLFRAAAAHGKAFASYSVLARETDPPAYRAMHWENLANGFDSWAAFYDLEASAGDQFSSADGGKHTTDYNAAYSCARTGGLAPSRRLEAWYLGLVDVKLVKWCRTRLKDMDGDVSALLSRELGKIVEAGSAPNANHVELGHRLLMLSERIAKGKRR